MKIGVLALQGDFREHIEMLKRCNTDSIPVKSVSDLKYVDGLIIPGGESTAIGNLMQKYGLGKAIVKHHKKGLAVYGTCAGAILLASHIAGSQQSRLNLLDISVRRNNYGRQMESFEADLTISEIGKFRGVFIRAPVIKKVKSDISVLSELDGNPVLIRNGRILASTFHPELTNDARIHKYFIGMVENGL